MRRNAYHGHFLARIAPEGLRPLHLARVPLLDEVLVAFRPAEAEHLVPPTAKPNADTTGSVSGSGAAIAASKNLRAAPTYLRIVSHEGDPVPRIHRTAAEVAHPDTHLLCEIKSTNSATIQRATRSQMASLLPLQMPGSLEFCLLPRLSSAATIAATQPNEMKIESNHAESLAGLLAVHRPLAALRNTRPAHVRAAPSSIWQRACTRQA